MPINLPTYEQQQQAITLLQELDIDISTLLAGRVVKSVQRGVIADVKPTSNGAVTRQVTISAVNVNKSLVFINAYKNITDDSHSGFTYTFTNNTTLALETYMQNTATTKVSWQVIEFY